MLVTDKQILPRNDTFVQNITEWNDILNQNNYFPTNKIL